LFKILGFDFDNGGIIMHALKMASEKFVHDITTDGSLYAISYANSGLNSSLNTYEILQSDINLCSIAEEIKMQGLKSRKLYLVKESCKEIMKNLLTQANLQISIEGRSSIFNQLEIELNKMFKRLGKNTNPPELDKRPSILNIAPRKHILKAPHEANHYVESVGIPNITSAEFGKFVLLSELIDQIFLGPKNTHQQDVYHARTSVNDNGIFYFHSFYDQNTDDTFKIFDSAIANTSNGKFSEDDVMRAKVKAIKAMNEPMTSVKRKQKMKRKIFWHGNTEQQHNQLRVALLNANKDDLVKISNEYIKKNQKSLVKYEKTEKEEKKSLKYATWTVVDLMELIRDPNPLIKL